jgi:hypothetical protein
MTKKPMSEAQKAALAKGRAKAIETWKANGGKWAKAAEAMAKKAAMAEAMVRAARKPALGPVSAELKALADFPNAVILAAATEVAFLLDLTPSKVGYEWSKWGWLSNHYGTRGKGYQLLLSAVWPRASGRVSSTTTVDNFPLVALKLLKKKLGLFDDEVHEHSARTKDYVFKVGEIEPPFLAE